MKQIVKDFVKTLLKNRLAARLAMFLLRFAPHKYALRVQRYLTRQEFVPRQETVSQSGHETPVLAGNKFGFVCRYGIADTFLVLDTLEEFCLENEVLPTEIVVYAPKNQFPLFNLFPQEYLIEDVETLNAEFGHIAKPDRGKLFEPHSSNPHFSHLISLSIEGKISDKELFSLFILGHPSSRSARKTQSTFRDKMFLESIDAEKGILFIPTSNSQQVLPKEFWHKLQKDLSGEGFDVVVNKNDKTYSMSDARQNFPAIDVLIKCANAYKLIIAADCGLARVMTCFLPKGNIMILTNQADPFIQSLTNKQQIHWGSRAKFSHFGPMYLNLRVSDWEIEYNHIKETCLTAAQINTRARAHHSALPFIPVSQGELIDRLSILEIKIEKLSGAKSFNSVLEANMLRDVALANMPEDLFDQARAELKSYNETAWELNEVIYTIDSELLERDQQYSQKIARTICKAQEINKQRVRVKNRLNETFGGALFEGKSFN